MYFALSEAGIFDHTFVYALRAALTAKSTSSFEAEAISAKVSSFAGFIVLKYVFLDGAIHFPSMKRVYFFLS